MTNSGNKYKFATIMKNRSTKKTVILQKKLKSGKFGKPCEYEMFGGETTAEDVIKRLEKSNPDSTWRIAEAAEETVAEAAEEIKEVIKMKTFAITVNHGAAGLDETKREFFVTAEDRKAAKKAAVKQFQDCGNDGYEYIVEIEETEETSEEFIKYTNEMLVKIYKNLKTSAEILGFASADDSKMMIEIELEAIKRHLNLIDGTVEESVEESVEEAPKKSTNKKSINKIYMASVTYKGKNEIQHVTGPNKTWVAEQLRKNGYRIQFISTPEKFDEDCEKYHDAVEKTKRIHKAQYDTYKNSAMRNEMTFKEWRAWLKAE